MNDIKMQFEVKKIINEFEDGYLTVKVKIKDYPAGETPPLVNHTVTGMCCVKVHVGDVLEAIGNWAPHKSYGLQFMANSIDVVIPEQIDAMELFIISHVDGVGRKITRALTQKFGIDLLDIIINKPDELKDVKGVTDKTLDRITKEIGSFITLREHRKKLNWLTPHDVVKLIDEFGSSAYSLLEKNPYLAAEIIGFNTCDLSAKYMRFDSKCPQRMEAAVIEVIDDELNDGNICTPKEDLLRKVRKFLNSSEHFEPVDLKEDFFDNTLRKLINSSKIVMEDNQIYSKTCYEIESKIVNALNGVRNTLMSKIHEQLVRNYLEYRRTKGLAMENEQENAVIMAINNRVSILTGGPGTGKTYITKIIIDVIRATEPYKTIVLAAPTGKAAKRMSDVTGMKCETIHKVFGINERNQPYKIIDADYVIIDEVSMMDIYQLYAVVSSIRKQTKLILIGDQNQLASVGPGSVLNDLIDSNCFTVTTLSRLHRQAPMSQISINANNILYEIEEIVEDREKKDFYFIDEENPEEILYLILKCVLRLIETEQATLEDIQIMSPQNHGPLGVHSINTEMQKFFNRNSEGIVVGDYTLKVSDKVMHNRNNAVLDVRNGETGIIIKIWRKEEEQHLEVDFGDRVVVYPKKYFHELLLAYALSVHKMQGSEAETTILPISREHRCMLTKHILYTALTRTKNRAILIGERDLYVKAMKNKGDTMRRSSIVKRLQKSTMAPH